MQARWDRVLGLDSCQSLKMTEERLVRAGYRGRSRPTVEELTFRLEAARQAEAAACSKYIKLRGLVKMWAESRGLENEGSHLHAMLREVGKWPEVTR